MRQLTVRQSTQGGESAHLAMPFYAYLRFCMSYLNINVNFISRMALIHNRVSRRVLHVSKITWGVLYLFQEAQTHWLPVLGVPPRVVPYTWPVLKLK